MAGEGFWLPPQFLTDDDDDVLSDNHHFCNSDFPYYHFPNQKTALSTGWGGVNGIRNGDSDLICRVAKLKMNGNDGFARATIPSFKSSVITALYNERISGIWSNSEQQIYQRVLMAQAAARDRAAAAVLLGGDGTAVKRSCAGTGVFLPRRYGSGCDGKNTAKPSHKFEVGRPRQGRPINPDYEWMVRRGQQRVSAMVEEARPICVDAARHLPQEWTY